MSKTKGAGRGKYKVYLCGGDMRLREDDCPGGHTPSPAGYIEWHEWAERMSKTHRQRRCKVCRLFAIWVPRG